MVASSSISLVATVFVLVRQYRAPIKNYALMILTQLLIIDTLQSLLYFISPMIVLTNSSLIMKSGNNRSVLCNLSGYLSQFCQLSQYAWIMAIELVTNPP